MEIVLSTLGFLALSVFIYLMIRWISLNNKEQRLDERKMDRIRPFEEKLQDGSLTPEDIEIFTEDVHTRQQAYSLLLKQGKLDLFPERYLNTEKGGECELVRWLELPTELNTAPDEIRHLKRVPVNDGDQYYHVYKFQVYEPHWTAKYGWMLGVAGPYSEHSRPYDEPKGTYSRLAKEETVDPEEEVKWVCENVSLV